MVKNSKIKVIFLSLILLFTFIVTSTQITYAEEPFDVEGKSAILIDAGTGKILYEKNIHEKLYPASITKIMLLLLAMEALENNKISLKDDVLITSNAAGMGGSQLYMEEGEVQKVEDLIKAVSIRSGNDTAVALAEHIAGSEELFVDMMNQRANELGMTNTNFVNTHGLHDDNHYTSAYDISIMSRELLKYPKVHEWLKIWMATLKVGKEKDSVQQMVNTNKLVKHYKGANGIKTGYTSKSMYCLAASATRGNLTLISVILSSPSVSQRNQDSMKILNHGFANYDSIPIVKKGEVIKNVPVSKGNIENVNIVADNNLSILVKKGESKDVEREILLPETIDAPIETNTKVGEIICRINGEEKGRVDLICKDEVQKISLSKMINRVFSQLLGK